MHIDLNDRKLFITIFVQRNSVLTSFFNRKSALGILAFFQDDDNLHLWKTKTHPPPADGSKMRNWWNFNGIKDNSIP